MNRLKTLVCAVLLVDEEFTLIVPLTSGDEPSIVKNARYNVLDGFRQVIIASSAEPPTHMRRDEKDDHIRCDFSRSNEAPS